MKSRQPLVTGQEVAGQVARVRQQQLGAGQEVGDDPRQPPGAYQEDGGQVEEELVLEDVVFDPNEMISKSYSTIIFF